MSNTGAQAVRPTRFDPWVPDALYSATRALGNQGFSRSQNPMPIQPWIQVTRTAMVCTATSSQRSALEEIEAKADNLPFGFSWVCEPYVGLNSRIFRVALSVLTGGAEPMLVLRWIRREAVIEDIAKEFKTTLQARLDASAEVVVGTFAP